LLIITHVYSNSTTMDTVTITTRKNGKKIDSECSIQECLRIIRTDRPIYFRIKSSEENYRTIVEEEIIALDYIEEQPNELCLLAVQKNSEAIDCIHDLDAFISYLLLCEFDDESLSIITNLCCQRKIDILKDILKRLELQNIKNDDITKEITLITDEIEKYTKLKQK